MEANQRRARWTYAEYARLPESGGTRYEVIGDELAVTPSPSSGHQRIATGLVVRMGSFAVEHGLGEVFVGPLDVLFGEGDYVQPDLLFVRADRLHVVSDRGVEGPPDLVVEIASPSTVARDRGVKLARYRHFGVPEYWIVDPEAETIDVWRADAEAGERYEAGDRLEWRPMPSGPALVLELAEVFGRG